MALSKLPSRQLEQLVLELGSLFLLFGCGQDQDVTRVTIKDGTTVVAPSMPGTESEPPGGAPFGDEPSDAGAVAGPCGIGRTPTYAFESRFSPGQSSVEYSSAVLRHVLIAELADFVGSVTARVENRERFAEGELFSAAQVWLDSPGEQIASMLLSLSLPGNPALLERVHGDLSSEGGLFAVLAGSDPVADHRPWSMPGQFVGFADGNLGRGGRTSFTPEDFVRACFEQLEINVGNRVLGFLQTDPARNLLALHLTRNGRDLQQLLRSFLLGAVAFSRGVDAELDDDVPGQGLLASTERAGDAPYAGLEHAWDVGFGYFGAARDYDRREAWSGSEPSGNLVGDWYDTNADCAISLESEVSFGAAAHAAAPGPELAAAEDFGQQAFEAFVAGRRWIAEAQGALSTDQIDELVELRNRAARAWERALAAVAVRALNQLSFQVGEALASSVDYSFVAHARHWSELKGTSLAFQFNRRSPFAAADFVTFQRLIGDAPVVPDTLPPENSAELAAYIDDLSHARDILRVTYAFDAGSVEGW